MPDQPSRQPIHQRHDNVDGVPMGGVTHGCGFTIAWQHGALREPDGALHEPNGAFVEDIIWAALGRLEHYQSSKFACEENEAAILSLRSAITLLGLRTARRLDRGVEGSHTV